MTSDFCKSRILYLVKMKNNLLVVLCVQCVSHGGDEVERQTIWGKAKQRIFCRSYDSGRG